jgi:Adenylate and Guanylate cyclase catalytic domain
MAEPPTGTVSFLFTDLERSTHLWEEHPDTMREALKHHDELLQAAIERHGGYRVKGTGDGVHAAFTIAEHAVAAAVAAQRALTNEDWGAVGPLRVRMGLHTGSAELRDGDYFGASDEPRRPADGRRPRRPASSVRTTASANSSSTAQLGVAFGIASPWASAHPARSRPLRASTDGSSCGSRRTPGSPPRPTSARRTPTLEPNDGR